MSILDKSEQDFISKLEIGERKNWKIMMSWIFGLIFVLWQVTKAILFGFTKYHFLDVQSLAIENALMWIFIAIMVVMARNLRKKNLKIIGKLMKALGDKNENISAEQ